MYSKYEMNEILFDWKYVINKTISKCFTVFVKHFSGSLVSFNNNIIFACGRRLDVDNNSNSI